ncbi:hypothetical protein NYZ99_00485 [Maribacter litopenaei]|uniref:Uncharacterized protein n=1 Tax=Maribacter litopenaei TaxID=2976127 RepID=A0ABY5YAB0_9FLAO|nr:hypothetical protein [Maribacter litopenaei]UWX55154.1 hypothetical protein NYZ99_00485 [Maribacter litopenaei]
MPEFFEQGIGIQFGRHCKKNRYFRATIYRYFSNADVLAAEAALDVSTKSPRNDL